jgi:hypothetical protein
MDILWFVVYLFEAPTRRKEDLLHRWEENKEQRVTNKAQQENPLRALPPAAGGPTQVYLIVWAKRVVWGASRVDWAKREKKSVGASEVGVTEGNE